MFTRYKSETFLRSFSLQASYELMHIVQLSALLMLVVLIFNAVNEVRGA